MALLKWELRKIWRPGILAAIALLGLFFYDIRPGFYLEHFRDGSDFGGTQFQLASGWLERYGTTMEPAERAELGGQLAELEAEFARQVTELPGAAEAGITDYASFQSWREKYDDHSRAGEAEEAASQLYWAIYYDTNMNMVESLVEFMERYDALAAGASAVDWGGYIEEPSPASAGSIERVQAVEAGPNAFGFLPPCVIQSTNSFFHYFAIWCVFSAVLLLSPTLVRDRLHGTRAMQWTACRGRKILDVQMGAALLSGLLLTLLNTAVYLGPFLSTGALRFWDCPLTGVWSRTFPWFDWSYGQYLLALSLLALLLVLAAAGSTVVLSQYSETYVAMLLKAIPLIFVLCWGLVPWVMEGAGLFSGGPTRLTGVPGSEFFLGGIAAALGIGMCGWSCRRQRKRELC